MKESGERLEVRCFLWMMVMEGHWCSASIFAKRYVIEYSHRRAFWILPCW